MGGGKCSGFYVIKQIISFLSARSIIAHHSFFTRGHRYYLDTLLSRKISKRHFLKDIENSFQEVTQIGPEPLFQISQQIELLETSKILAEMGRSWQAD